MDFVRGRIPVGLRLSELPQSNFLPLSCSELEGRLTHLVKNKNTAVSTLMALFLIAAGGGSYAFQTAL